MKSQDLSLGDTFFKVRFGKNISYYKCVITGIEVSLANQKTLYHYKILGKSKDKTKRVGTDFSILAYRVSFFVDKLSMFKSYDSMIDRAHKLFKGRYLSKQFKEEIVKSRTQTPYLWI